MNVRNIPGNAWVRITNTDKIVMVNDPYNLDMNIVQMLVDGLVDLKGIDRSEWASHIDAIPDQAIRYVEDENRYKLTPLED